jgi:hypothetical protein
MTVNATDIDRKLCLTAALVGARTRKDLAAAFRRVNPRTPFDVERAHKWLQGRARPREQQLYDDWAAVLDVGRPGDWIADCDLASFVEVICRERHKEREPLLRRAQAFGGDAERPQRGPARPVEVDLAGVFVGYSYSWSPYFRDRLLRGGLRIAHVPGGGFTASYSQARHTHDPNLAHGEVGVLQRGLLLDLREPHGRTAFLFTLFPPSSPVSVLGGLMCGPALLGPDPQPSVTRIVLVRLPEWPPLLSTAECIMDPGASLADDLAALGAAVTDPGQAERLIVEFLSQRSGAGYDHVTIGPYRALVDFFDREWIARAFPGG